MLTGPEPLDLRAQLGNRLFGRHRRLRGFGHRGIARHGLGAGLGDARHLVRGVVALGRLGGFGHGAADHPRVGRMDALPLHLGDFLGHGVEVGLHGIEALLRQVRQFGLGGRARDVELGGQRPHGVEGPAGVADRLLLTFGRRLQHQRLVVGLEHLLAQVFERADALVEKPLPFDAGGEQAFALLAHDVHVAAAGGRALVHLPRRVLEAAHFGHHGHRPLAQGRL